MAETEQSRMVRVPEAQGKSGLDGYFGITERGSTVRTEIAAGVTTWLTMAYILFVNPAILGAVKDSQGVSLTFPEVLTVTALVAGVMTLAMGIYGRYPFALAAGLGLNAFVAFSLVGTLGLTWPQAMGVIVAEGILITIFVLTGLRELILNAIPMDLKRAIGSGSGCSSRSSVSSTPGSWCRRSRDRFRQSPSSRTSAPGRSRSSSSVCS